MKKAVSLALLLPLLFPLAANSDDSNTKSYWDGSKLNNQQRLTDPYDGFETQNIQKKNQQASESYLLQMRKEVVEDAKKRADAQAVLNYGGNSPASALEISYPQQGTVRVVVHASYLFDENSSSLKTGSVDVLNRLTQLIQTKEGRHIELVIHDTLDDAPESKEIDAQRAHLIFGYLNLQS